MIFEDYSDLLIKEVNDYIVKGKKNKRGEENARAAMILAIEKACRIHPKGIEVGQIDYERYKKEVRRRKKWWDRVRSGDATDSRNGFKWERLGYHRVGERPKESKKHKGGLSSE